MSRKIDIELTSARADGTWTWRVAGAKQPKGVLDGGLLPGGAKVGDVLRAEAEFELDGTIITAVTPPPGKRPEPDRLELITDARPFEGVTTSLVPKGSRPRRDRDDRGPRPERSGRPDSAGGRPSGPSGPGSRPGPRTGDGGFARPGPRTGDGPGSRPDRGPRPPRSEPTPGGPGRDPARAEDGRGAPGRPPGRRPDSRRPDGQRARTDAQSDRDGDAGRREHAPGRPDRTPATAARPKRLSPASTHRNAVLESLAPEERAVAEQLLHGGIPAVRRAVQEQNARAREDGRPEVKAEPLLALAEELLPRLKGAEWRDRADAAAKDADEIGLRDLRSVVAGAEAGARDDESRILAKTLREALDRREVAARESWVAEITTCLDEGRVTRALRVAGRPPDPRSRFPTELISRLTDAASAAMAPDTPPDRWAALLAAVLESPVRRAVKPAGLPDPASDALLGAARQASGRIPALAAILGLQMPPPPGPPRPGARPPRPIPPPRRDRPPTTTAEAPTAATPIVDTPIVDTPAVDTPPLDAAIIEPPAVDTPPLEAAIIERPAVDTTLVDTTLVDAPHEASMPDTAPLHAASLDPVPGDAATPSEAGSPSYSPAPYTPAPYTPAPYTPLPTTAAPPADPVPATAPVAAAGTDAAPADSVIGEPIIEEPSESNGGATATLPTHVSIVEPAGSSIDEPGPAPAPVPDTVTEPLVEG